MVNPSVMHNDDVNDAPSRYRFRIMAQMWKERLFVHLLDINVMPFCL